MEGAVRFQGLFSCIIFALPDEAIQVLKYCNTVSTNRDFVVVAVVVVIVVALFQRSSILKQRGNLVTFPGLKYVRECQGAFISIYGTVLMI